MQEYDSWSEAIYSDFYNYDDCGWHEHGPTDVVDTLVLEDGTEKYITLYVNTKDGVVECDNSSDWREEMGEEGIDTTSKEEIKKYLINIYNIKREDYE